MGGAGRRVGATPTASLGATAFVANLIAESLRQGWSLCIDSQVLILSFAVQEPIASLVAPILEHPDVTVVVSTVTLSEVITLPQDDADRQDILAMERDVLALPRLVAVDFDRTHAREAAIVRQQTHLRLPDAAVVATARLANAFAILGNDRRWKNKPLGVPYHHLDDILALP